MDKIECWVIMDINKKAIACGSPRNRSMRLVEKLKNYPMRILMYGTEKRAVAAFSGGLGFFDETDGYLRNTYSDDKDSIWYRKPFSAICIPVKVSLVFDDRIK